MHNNKSVLATTDNNRANTTRGRGTGGNRRSAWGPAKGGGSGGGGGGGGGGRAGGEWVTVYEGVDSTAKVGKRGDQAQTKGPCCATPAAPNVDLSQCFFPRDVVPTIRRERGCLSTYHVLC